MKRILMAILFIFGLSVSANATVAQFPIQVTIPSASQVNFIVSEIEGTNFTPHTGNFLNMDSAGAGMRFDSTNGIWTGSRFFAIDFSPSNGTNPAPANYGSISFSYGSQIVPAGQPLDEGLNKRATIAANKVTGVTGNQTETPIFGARAIGVGSLPTLNDSSVSGGFLRVYIGLSTGEESSPGVPVAANSKPFTNADKGGVYQGTLTITATLI